ncbi:hypothetical protein POF50_004620 [Streptomyces sp. SL13]|uniref:Uncharacterized protein n=1 Tax=Streptantibioticus silvisoli TaxID=2705255 RepID=A0AA90H139_9ACTN|nr:hypothetical protein [Streptantibioticus silvisoli]MDI5968635.1 hypothetical protein [Streptantibioticus silvisoli]
MFKNFVAHSSALLEETGVLVRFDRVPDDAITPELAERATALAATVRDQWLEVALVGPASAEKSARVAREASNELAFYLRVAARGGSLYEIRSPASRAQKHSSELAKAIDAFVETARDALDDDGSKG